MKLFYTQTTLPATSVVYHDMRDEDGIYNIDSEPTSQFAVVNGVIWYYEKWENRCFKPISGWAQCKAYRFTKIDELPDELKFVDRAF
jgi:hypothetical protein